MPGSSDPIFVIGTNRSGTKWLSNLLANHSDVAAVQHEDHTGILETNAFNAWRYKYPDLSPDDEFVGLVESWVRSDFFSITGLPAEFFYSLRPRPADPVEMFRALMDAYAAASAKGRWLQKLSPWHAEEARARFPGARFVVIERDREEVLRSSHYLTTRGQKAIGARAIASHHLQERILRRLIQGGAVPVRYVDLRSGTERELERICGAVGLPYEPGMIDLPWSVNTSFRSDSAKTFELSDAERRRVRLLGRALDWIPDGALELLRRVSPPATNELVEGTFRRLREKLDLG